MSFQLVILVITLVSITYLIIRSRNHRSQNLLTNPSARLIGYSVLTILGGAITFLTAKAFSNNWLAVACLTLNQILAYLFLCWSRLHLSATPVVGVKRPKPLIALMAVFCVELLILLLSLDEFDQYAIIDIYPLRNSLWLLLYVAVALLCCLVYYTWFVFELLHALKFQTKNPKVYNDNDDLWYFYRCYTYFFSSITWIAFLSSVLLSIILVRLHTPGNLIELSFTSGNLAILIVAANYLLLSPLAKPGFKLFTLLDLWKAGLYVSALKDSFYWAKSTFPDMVHLDAYQYLGVRDNRFVLRAVVTTLQDVRVVLWVAYFNSDNQKNFVNVKASGRRITVKEEAKIWRLAFYNESFMDTILKSSQMRETPDIVPSLGTINIMRTASYFVRLVRLLPVKEFVQNRLIARRNY